MNNHRDNRRHQNPGNDSIKGYIVSIDKRGKAGTIKNLFGRQYSYNFDVNSLPVNCPFDTLKINDQIEYTVQNNRVSINRVFKDNERLKFLNPYNFVRYMKIGSEPNDNNTEMLTRTTPPAHNIYVNEYLTGKIVCECTTQSPLFIAGDESDNNEDHKILDFFKVNDQHTIPGSSLRGMVRSVFEAATNSCFGFLDGDRLSYHYDPNQAKDFIPARVEETQSGYVVHLLPGKKGPNDKPNTVKAAWVRLDEQNQFEINGVKHRSECWALINNVPIRHHSGRFSYWKVEKLAENKSDLELVRVNFPNCTLQQGWLFITYRNMFNKHDERFFFRTNDLRGFKECLPLDDSAVKDYNNLINDYKKRHEDKIKNSHNKQLVQAGGNNVYLSRFITDKQNGLADKDLVYVKLNQDKSKVLFIAPVSIPRLSYPHSIVDLLPDGLHSCDNFNKNKKSLNDLKLCPACRTFGWVKSESGNNKNTITAYKGRVTFSDGKFTNNLTSIPEIHLSILSAPKPTTTAFYLLNDKGNPAWGLEYKKGTARLRGRKLYLKPVPSKSEYQRNIDENPNTNQNKTIKNVINKDNKFSFTINFSNLHPVELGALLWSLQLENGWLHQLGMAKPYGFGQLTININCLLILNVNKRYLSLSDNGYDNYDKDKREGFIHKFKDAMKSFYGSDDFDKLENIIDLKTLMTKVDQKVHYPRPPYRVDNTRPDPEGKQFEWFVGNKKECNQFTLSLTNEKGPFPLIQKSGERR